MFTLEIISGPQGSGKTFKLKEKLSTVGGTLLPPVFCLIF